jgi:hypothetical protein
MGYQALAKSHGHSVVITVTEHYSNLGSQQSDPFRVSLLFFARERTVGTSPYTSLRRAPSGRRSPVQSDELRPAGAG